MRLIHSLSVVVILATVAPAQIVDSWVVPSAYATKNGPSRSSFPFTYTNYVRYQQAIDAATMGRPRRIDGMAFRPKEWGTGQQQPFVRNLSIKISLSAKAVNQLDGTYANNVKGTQVEVWRGPVYFPTPTGNSPAEFSVTVWFSQSFLYTGTDPLLIDIVPLDPCAGGGTSQTCDYDNASSGMGAVLGKNKNGCGTPMTGGSRTAGGFVIKFFGSALMPYGLGCKGSNGVPAISHTGGAPSRGNAMFQVRLSSARPTTGAVLVLGFSRDKLLNTVPLPLDLTAIGARGCFLWADLVLIGTTATDASGNGGLVLPIPNDVGLADKAFYVQWLVADAGANSANLVASPGGIVAIR